MREPSGRGIKITLQRSGRSRTMSEARSSPRGDQARALSHSASRGNTLADAGRSRSTLEHAPRLAGKLLAKSPNEQARSGADASLATQAQDMASAAAQLLPPCWIDREPLLH